MPDIPLAVWAVSVAYAVLVAAFGEKPGAPLILRWPYAGWDLIAHAWRTPAPALHRPDYAKIDRLERELGLVDAEPERPIRAAKTVCLTKNCAGETVELRTWSGMLAVSIHECETP
ncbi:hypothetical protein [Streptomyces sp. NPDC057293]|uniref:hypothetical protein n=1 Tax=unclassified Streptomyces TaxID=2593676 RepID=UPI0036355F0A